MIIHDQLVPDAVVQMGRRDAEQIAAGKAKGHHSFSQAQINTLIVRLAREGKKVRGSSWVIRWCSGGPAKKSLRCARLGWPIRSCRVSLLLWRRPPIRPRR